MPRQSRVINNKSQYFPTKKRLRHTLIIDDVGAYSITKPHVAELISHDILKYWFSVLKKRRLPTIVDANAGWGGNTISFASHPQFKSVLAVEKDGSRVRALNNNLKAFNLCAPAKDINALCSGKVDVIHSDILDLISEIKSDILFFDPPWNQDGDPWYSKRGIYMLNLSSIALWKVVQKAFESTDISMVCIKAPYNFDLRTFCLHLSDHLITAKKISSFLCIFVSRT